MKPNKITTLDIGESLMPEPRSAEEWATKCNIDYITSMRVEGKSHGHRRQGLCLDCARAFAGQECAAQMEDKHFCKAGFWWCQEAEELQAAHDALQQQVEVLEGALLELVANAHVPAWVAAQIEEVIAKCRETGAALRSERKS